MTFLGTGTLTGHSVVAEVVRLWSIEFERIALAKVIEAICSDSEGVLQKRGNAFQYAHAHLGQDALAKDWARALRGCAE